MPVGAIHFGFKTSYETLYPSMDIVNRWIGWLVGCGDVGMDTVTMWT